MYDDTCRFLAEQFSADFFLQYPGLIPFASLGRTSNPEATLRQAAQAVNRISDPTTQANLTAASAILAGLRLGDEIVYRILRRDIMQESTVYRSIQKEAEARAKMSTQREIAVKLLQAGIAINLVASATGLPIEEVQQIQQQMNDSSQN